MATSTASGDGDGGGRLSFWSGGWGVFFPDFDRFSSSSSRSWFRRKSALRFALIETGVRRKSRSRFFVFDRSVLRLPICNFVFMLWVLLGSRVFLLFRESLKGKYFSGFFWFSTKQGFDFFVFGRVCRVYRVISGTRPS